MGEKMYEKGSIYLSVYINKVCRLISNIFKNLPRLKVHTDEKSFSTSEYRVDVCNWISATNKIKGKNNVYELYRINFCFELFSDSEWMK